MKTVKDESGKVVKLGSIGEYPSGKLQKDDDGAALIAITADTPKGVVRIEFGTNMSWLALYPDQAIEFAEVIIAKANELRN
jgi:hypothetical protein